MRTLIEVGTVRPLQNAGHSLACDTSPPGVPAVKLFDTLKHQGITAVRVAWERGAK
jgi:hypothetical protein